MALEGDDFFAASERLRAEHDEQKADAGRLLNQAEPGTLDEGKRRLEATRTLRNEVVRNAEEHHQRVLKAIAEQGDGLRIAEKVEQALQNYLDRHEPSGFDDSIRENLESLAQQEDDVPPGEIQFILDQMEVNRTVRQRAERRLQEIRERKRLWGN